MRYTISVETRKVQRVYTPGVYIVRLAHSDPYTEELDCFFSDWGKLETILARFRIITREDILTAKLYEGETTSTDFSSPGVVRLALLPAYRSVNSPRFITLSRENMSQLIDQWVEATGLHLA